MPKGKHKGGKRHFTNFEAMEDQKKREEKERQWRKERGEESDTDEEKETEKKKESEESDSSDESGTGSDESSSESEGEVKEEKPKGVQSLIEVSNPNRVVSKAVKVSQLDTTESAAGVAAAKDSKPQLSRREREEVEKQHATARYRKMHAEGKTDEAKADLARLMLIKQQREEALKKKEEEKKAKEEAAAAKKDQLAKTLGKKR